MRDLARRRLLRMLAAVGAAPLAGCDRLAANASFMAFIDKAEALTYRAQRLLVPRSRLAPEFDAADISAKFRPNGSTDPQGPDYRRLARDKFARWKLEIGGLVETPLSLSLADLRAVPARTQITRHDCVEGWSCIGKWTGAPLATLLDRAKPRADAKYVVFRCFDSPDRDEGGGLSGSDGSEGADDSSDEGSPAYDLYYESIDLVDAYHPQTILAYEMNDAPLPVAYGAPLRARIERQLGYKMAKYIRRIDLVDSYAKIGQGQGGYWEDRGYEWYAGI